LNLAEYLTKKQGAWHPHRMPHSLLSFRVADFSQRSDESFVEDAERLKSGSLTKHQRRPFSVVMMQKLCSVSLAAGAE
jgi:hypothetical protein